MDFYHSPVAVWVNSAPQPKRWGPRAHRGITWTSVDLSLVTSSDIHLRVITQEITSPRIAIIISKITYQNFHLDLPGTNELTNEDECKYASVNKTIIGSDNGLAPGCHQAII